MRKPIYYDLLLSMAKSNYQHFMLQTRDGLEMKIVDILLKHKYIVRSSRDGKSSLYWAQVMITFKGKEKAKELALIHEL